MPIVKEELPLYNQRRTLRGYTGLAPGYAKYIARVVTMIFDHMQVKDTNLRVLNQVLLHNKCAELIGA
jgi:hypothetical protein